MKYVFWFFWALELGLLLWVLLQNIQRPASNAFPYLFLGLAWVFAALYFRMGLGWYSIANNMVGILAIPIIGYGLFLAIVLTTKGPGRWN